MSSQTGFKKENVTHKETDINPSMSNKNRICDKWTEMHHSLVLLRSAFSLGNRAAMRGKSGGTPMNAAMIM